VSGSEGGEVQLEMYFPKDDFAIPASFIVFVLLARTTRRVVYLEAGSHIQMSPSAHGRGRSDIG
jgi:hypothetical protein